MGEIPIFTSDAHVFVIDPITKKSWIPSSKSAVQVNFYFDSARKTYRIISVEGSKAVINSTIRGEMIFTKTSAKFGQWADLQGNTVYGLGFASDTLLDKFTEQFDVIRDKAKNLQQSAESKASNGIADTDSDKTKEFNKSEDSSQSQNGDVPANDSNLTASLKRLQVQNENLKQSLFQSSSNLKKRDADVASAKSTNKNLKKTLQDAMTTVEEWRERSSSLEEENDALKKRIKELEEEAKQATSKHVLKDSLKELELLRQEHREKLQECNMLQQRVGVLSVVERQHNECAVTIKNSLEENHQLQERIEELEVRLDELLAEKKARHSLTLECCAQIAGHLTEMTDATQRLQANG